MSMTNRTQLSVEAGDRLIEGRTSENTVLIAMDGSPASQSAAHIAVQLARSQHFSVYGLYVADLMVLLGENYGDYHSELGSFEEPGSEAETIDLFERQGALALGWLRQICHQGHVPLETEIILGGVPELIISKATHARLISLGRRGYSHTSEMQHLGSNFRSIAHHVHRPIIAGSEDAWRRPIERIVLAYNGSRQAENALAWAPILQQAFSCHITVLSVSELDRSPVGHRVDIQDHLYESGLSYDRLVIRSGQPAEEIVAAAVEYRAQLILMGSYRHGEILEWLTGSTVDYVLCNTRLPVFIV